jgi:hypothetical protein
MATPAYQVTTWSSNRTLYMPFVKGFAPAIPCATVSAAAAAIAS